MLGSKSTKISRTQRQIQFYSASEKLNYQEIRQKYGVGPTAKRLIDLLEARHEARRKSGITYTRRIPRVAGIPLAKNKIDLRNSLKKSALESYRVKKDTETVRQMLATIVRRDEIARWMRTSNASLDNLTPGEVIDLGQTQRVIDLVRQVQEGVYV